MPWLETSIATLYKKLLFYQNLATAALPAKCQGLKNMCNAGSILPVLNTYLQIKALLQTISRSISLYQRKIIFI